MKSRWWGIQTVVEDQTVKEPEHPERSWIPGSFPAHRRVNKEMEGLLEAEVHYLTRSYSSGSQLIAYNDYDIVTALVGDKQIYITAGNKIDQLLKVTGSCRKRLPRCLKYDVCNIGQG